MVLTNILDCVQVGYVVLCILASRAEMLKVESTLASSQSLQTWKSHLFSVYEHLSGHLSRLFLSTQQTDSSSTVTTDKDSVHLSSSPLNRLSPPPAESEYYTWQFLALLAMNLEPAPCHEMVAELR